MNKTNHTPARWNFTKVGSTFTFKNELSISTEETGQTYQIYPEIDRTICIATVEAKNFKKPLLDKYLLTDVEAKANARILSASPELAEALSDILDRCEKAFSETGYPAFFHDGTLTKARYALSKAGYGKNNEQ